MDDVFRTCPIEILNRLGSGSEARQVSDLQVPGPGLQGLQDWPPPYPCLTSKPTKIFRCNWDGKEKDQMADPFEPSSTGRRDEKSFGGPIRTLSPGDANTWTSWPRAETELVAVATPQHDIHHHFHVCRRRIFRLPVT